MGFGLDRAIPVGLDGAGECVKLHVRSLSVVPANFRHEHPGTTRRDTEKPLDVPFDRAALGYSIVLRFGHLADHRPARMPAPPPPGIPPESRRAAGRRSRCPAFRSR